MNKTEFRALGVDEMRAILKEVFEDPDGELDTYNKAALTEFGLDNWDEIDWEEDDEVEEAEAPGGDSPDDDGEESESVDPATLDEYAIDNPMEAPGGDSFDSESPENPGEPVDQEPEEEISEEEIAVDHSLDLYSGRPGRERPEPKKTVANDLG